MFPPVYDTLASDSDVVSLIGDSDGDVPVYEFDYVPPGIARPYVAFQVVYGTPEIYLGDRPNVDAVGIQFDVYARTGEDCQEIFEAVRDAVEGVAHVVSYQGASRDRKETLAYQITFTADWFVDR